MDKASAEARHSQATAELPKQEGRWRPSRGILSDMGIFQQRGLRGTTAAECFDLVSCFAAPECMKTSGVVDRLHPVDKQGRITSTSPALRIAPDVIRSV